jgi:hypothetical protein
VNPPRVLLPVLGSRGVAESVARAIGRPLMANAPWIRQTERAAEVILAQNRATGRILGKGGKVQLLSNALAVEIDSLPASTQRNRQVLFVGRLLGWKAPMLALSAFRHVQTPGAVLVFCGRGPELHRLERAVRRWRIEDRVRFEGWLPRERLLSALSTAGALLHPAVHEEAGLCIAESLTLGTPVICLDHGGPPEIVCQWPAALSAVVAPRNTENTARSIAAAIDEFLANPPPVRSVSQPPALSFREELLSAYESAVSRFGPRGNRLAARQREPQTFAGEWTGLPSPRSPRWTLPKGPRPVSRSGLYIYHPVTFKGRVGWEIGRLIADLDLFRFLPASHPPEDLWEALLPYLPSKSFLAVARTNHPRRYVALAMDDQGDLLFAAKLAKDKAGRAKLQREREHVEVFGPLLPSPIKAPRVLAYEDGVLVLEAVRWKPRIPPWLLSEAIAYALGGFFEATKPNGSETAGIAHGDCAPWNLFLDADGGWTLVDWEDARGDAPPFYDVFHYLVQSNQELFMPRRGAIVKGLSGRGWIGRAIRAYADGAGISAQSAEPFFRRYLNESRASLDPLVPQRALRVRQDLARRISASGPHRDRASQP